MELLIPSYDCILAVMSGLYPLLIICLEVVSPILIILSFNSYLSIKESNVDGLVKTT